MDGAQAGDRCPTTDASHGAHHPELHPCVRASEPHARLGVLARQRGPAHLLGRQSGQGSHRHLRWPVPRAELHHPRGHQVPQEREYGVREILGVSNGYNGLSDPENNPPISLTEELVRDIHMKGGSIIKAARGGFDAPKICDNLAKQGINVLFLVGGDGTQFAGNLLFEEARKRNLKVSIVGIPKSIDNDVVLFDRTFGFETAVDAASQVIRNAWVEASSCNRGVGIVKLMGRDSGFVAMHAATAADVVDLCMIPEVTVDLKDVLAHVDAVLAARGYMVIAVAEGAGQEMVSTGKKDATGHTVYGDIGVHLRDTLNAHLKPSGGRTFYIDPSYIIRSVPIIPNDHIYCVRLANDAVHTAMRGYSGVCVGAMHNVICMLPSKLMASGKKKVRQHSSSWQGCVQICNMPRALAGLSE
ncbi:unnamed protein product [Effrenium voratum]|nr:unnamed protein product [Effrenium voratum]